MSKDRCRVLTQYIAVLPVTDVAELGSVPADVGMVVELTGQGLLLFRDPNDVNYLLVVQPDGLDVLPTQTGGDKDEDEDSEDDGDRDDMVDEYLSRLAAPGYSAAAFPAPDEAVLGFEQGWDVIFYPPKRDEPSRDDEDDELAGLTRLAPNLTNLPERADADVARHIIELGGLIYFAASGDDYDYIDEGPPIFVVSRFAAELETFVNDPQDPTDYPDGYIRVIIPPTVERVHFGQIMRSLDRLARYGVDFGEVEFAAEDDSYHIGYVMAAALAASV